MPKSPLICFCEERRPGVTAENPGLAFGDISKKLIEKWKNLSAEEKEKYIKMAEQENEEDKNRINNIEDLYQYFEFIPKKNIKDLKVSTESVIHLVKLRNMANELSKHFSKLSTELDSTLSNIADKLVDRE